MRTGPDTVAVSTTAPGAVEISIIVPALNEAANLPQLAARVDASLQGRGYELIIVDDNSRDRTPDVCAQLAETYPLRLIVRDVPKNGLSGAVLRGLSESRGDLLVIMDADLQHPPEKIPDLLAPLVERSGDFSVGSRYVEGGSTEARWGFFRRINSKVATWLARPFSGKTHDPMSGFFALRRETYLQGTRLTPLGYKIGLELMCKCRVESVRETPIHFAARVAGQSKLTIKEQFRYLEHLSRLYDFYYPRAAPILKFLIVLACGWFVSVGALLYLQMAGVATHLALGLSYPATIAVTAVFHLRYVRTQREFLLPGSRPWLEFWVTSLFEWIACCSASAWLMQRSPAAPIAEAFVITYGAAAVARYIVRKELMQDVRGLRQDLRARELADPSFSSGREISRP